MRAFTEKDLYEENYLDTLSIICNRMMEIDDYYDRFDELEEIYSELSQFYDCDYQLERIYSAVYCLIEG